jgi:hypothetical protein
MVVSLSGGRNGKPAVGQAWVLCPDLVDPFIGDSDRRDARGRAG